MANSTQVFDALNMTPHFMHQLSSGLFVMKKGGRYSLFADDKELERERRRFMPT